MTTNINDDVFDDIWMDGCSILEDDPFALPSSTISEPPYEDGRGHSDSGTDAAADFPGNVETFQCSNLLFPPQIFSNPQYSASLDNNSNIDPASLILNNQPLIPAFEVCSQEFSAAQPTTNVGINFTSVSCNQVSRFATEESDSFDLLIKGTEVDLSSTLVEHERQPFISDFGNLNCNDFQVPRSASTTQPTTKAHADFQYLASSLENPFIKVAVPFQDVAPAEINREFGHSNSFGLCNGVDVVPPLNQGVSWSINSNVPPTATNFESDFFDYLQLLNPVPENNDKNASIDLLIEKKPSWDGSLDLSHGSVGEMGIENGNLNPQSPMNVKNLPVGLPPEFPEVAAFPFPVQPHLPTISSHHHNSFSTQVPISLDAVGSQFLLNPTGCVGAFNTSSQNASRSWNDFCTHSHTLPVNRGPINSITELDDYEREIYHSNHSTLSQSQNSDPFYAQATADGNIDMEICLAPRSSICWGRISRGFYVGFPSPCRTGKVGRFDDQGETVLHTSYSIVY